MTARYHHESSQGNHFTSDGYFHDDFYLAEQNWVNAGRYRLEKSLRKFRLVYALKVKRKVNPDSQYTYISANSQIYDISYERFLSAHSAQPPVKLEVLEKPSSDTFTCSNIELFSFKPSQFTCALWLLMPARHEKIIGESDWGAVLPTKDSHLSGDNEKTSATWPRGMFTAPGIAPSDANSLGWRRSVK